MKVAIIHPWLPQYRLSFFSDLVRAGRDAGIEFDIFYGDTSPEWRGRNDEGECSAFNKLPTKFFRIGTRSLNYKALSSVHRLGPYDLIIAEQAVRNLETYQLLTRRTAVAFWGHGRTYTKSTSALQEWLKLRLTKQGVWFFAYTPGGIESVVSAGFPRENTTVVQNAIDTKALASAVRSVSDSERGKFEVQYGLKGKTAIFLGGLDESKRLPFLLTAARICHERDQDFRLLIAGDGTSRGLVETFAAGVDYVHYLGPLFGETKALALSAAQVLAMPGRVGLVAVDSFAALTPVVTTKWEWHAPEFEYLEHGSNAVISSNDASSYAAELLAVLSNQSELDHLRRGCLDSGRQYTVQEMVRRFLEGVKSALGVLS